MKDYRKSVYSRISTIRSKLVWLYYRGSIINEIQPHISMFHDIYADGQMNGDPYACSIRDLIRYVDYCTELGLNFGSTDDLSNGLFPHKYQCLITFDDGFSSTLKLAAPELIKRNIPFTVFVTTSYLNQNCYLTSRQLEELSQIFLCNIGMHCHQHILWRYEKSINLSKDFNMCKKTIESITGKTPMDFAFPYGSYFAVSGSNIKTIRQMGVRTIFLTDQRKLVSKDYMNLCNGLPRLDIPGYFNGHYDMKVRGLKIGQGCN